MFSLWLSDEIICFTFTVVDVIVLEERGEWGLEGWGWRGGGGRGVGALWSGLNASSSISLSSVSVEPVVSDLSEGKKNGEFK